MRNFIFFLICLLSMPLAAQTDLEVIIAESGGQGVVSQIAYSGDGKAIAFNRNGMVLLCDVRTGKIVRNFRSEFKNIKVMALSPSGNFLACVGDGQGSKGESLVQVWNLRSGDGWVTALNDGKKINTLVFSPDGKLLASGGNKNDIYLHEIFPDQEPRLLFTLGKDQGGHRKDIRSLNFSKDGNLLVSGAEDNTIKLWDIPNRSLRKTIDNASGDIFSVDIDPQGRYLVGGGRDDKIRLLDLETGALKELTGHEGNVFHVRFSPDGKTIVSSARDRTVKFWDLEGTSQYSINLYDYAKEMAYMGQDSEKELRPWLEQTVFAISPDGNYLAFASYSLTLGMYTSLTSYSSNGSVAIFDIRRKELMRRVPQLTSSPVNNLFFSQDGKRLCTFSDDRNVQVLNLEQVGQDLAFEIPDTSIHNMFLSPDWRYVLYRRGTVMDWSIGYELAAFPGGATTDEEYSFNNRKVITSFSARNDADPYFFQYLTPSVAFSPDGRYLARVKVENDFCTLVIWDLGQGEPASPMMAEIPIGNIHRDEGYLLTIPVQFTSNGKYVAVGIPGKVILFETGNWQEWAGVLDLPSADGDCIMLQFLDNDRVLSAVYWLTKEDGSLNGQQWGFAKIDYSSPGASSEKSKIKKLGKGLLKALTTPEGGADPYANMPVRFGEMFGKKSVPGDLTHLMGFDFAFRRRKVNAYSQDGTIRVETDNDILRFQGLAGLDADVFNGLQATTEIEGGLPKEPVLSGSYATSVAFSPDNRFVAVGGENGSVELRQRATGNLLLTAAVAGTEYIFLSEDNYYATARDGGKLVMVRIGQDYYPFDVLDVKFNRPDLIWELLSDPEKGLVARTDETTSKFAAYRKAYEKRIEKMGLQESELVVNPEQLPRVTILNIDQLPIETTERMLDLSLELDGAGQPLAELHIYVNDVPVFGSKGLDLQSEGAQQLRKDLQIPLSAGKNDIQFMTVNAAGLKSFRETVPNIRYTGEKGPVDLYLIAIGVSSYEDAAMDLRFARKDAEEVVRLFESHASRYRQVHTFKLVDADATRERILALDEALQLSQVDDQVIIYFAGHGLYDADYTYYLATHDIDFSSPSGKGLAYDQLVSLLDGIPARNKLLMMDACHSGEIDQENVVKVETLLEADTEVSFRSFGSTTMQSKQVGLENSFELMKTLFADLRDGTGAAVIAAAGGLEYAREGGGVQNGVFTYALLQGLEKKEADKNGNGQIIVSELQSYLNKKVAELTKNQQRPTSRSRKFSNDWVVW